LAPAAASADGTTVITGTTTESSGLVSSYRIEVPQLWNGTLLLYSHGYSLERTTAQDVSDPVTGQWLLGHGYALAGSSYASTGWAVEQAMQDQMAVLDVFDARVGHPRRTIAWGHSLGGMISAGLVQRFPSRFTAAMPMSGALAGGPGFWNQGLDSEFAVETLVAPGAFKLVNFTASDVYANLAAAKAALAVAQTTAQGRARVALSAALADVPGWYDPTAPEPGATDYAAQEANQYAWESNAAYSMGFLGRFELEGRAGGNFSWNTGVDYRAQLALSSAQAEVKALYASAGLDLARDLSTLNGAPRISAGRAAVDYVTRFITFNGVLGIPVMTVHTTGDGIVEVTNEQAYSSVVSSSGDSSMLQQVFVDRAGHGTFTPAETISAFETLVDRIDTGSWVTTSPASMNLAAASLGQQFNTLSPGGPPVAPAFDTFQPAQFLRPYDARNIKWRV
jgi:pimeloyl-ACP methyl ester carboxylesterase